MRTERCATSSLLAILIGAFFSPLALAAQPSAHPQVSQDGNTVVYFSMDSKAGTASISSYDRATNKRNELVNDGYFNVNPSLSPDGKTLVYASARPNMSGQWDIYTKNLRTGKTTQLTNTKERDMHAFWSRDGKWITYVTIEGEGINFINKIKPDGKELQKLTELEGAKFHPKWSMDSKYIVFDSGVFMGQRNISMFNLASGQLSVPVPSGESLSVAAPSFSPDGNFLVYAARPIDRESNEGGSIWLKDLTNGSYAKVIQFEKGVSVGGPVMPDNNSIIFHKNENGLPQLHQISVDGSNLQKLMRHQ